MEKIKENKSFFDNSETINYKPFKSYSLNGATYLFSDYYYDDNGNYYSFRNNKYYKIKKNKIGNSSFIKLKDINANNIIVII